MSSGRWFPVVEVALYPAAVKEDEEEFTVMTTLECDIHSFDYNNVVFAPTFQIELTESAQ